MGDTTKGRLYAEQILRMWYGDLSEDVKKRISGHDLDACANMFTQAIDQDPDLFTMLEREIASEAEAEARAPHSDVRHA